MSFSFISVQWQKYEQWLLKGLPVAFSQNFKNIFVTGSVRYGNRQVQASENLYRYLYLTLCIKKNCFFLTLILGELLWCSANICCWNRCMSISYLLFTSFCLGNGSRHTDYKIHCCKLIYNTLCHKTSATKLKYQSLVQNKTQIILILECSLMNDLTTVWQDVPMIHTPKNLSLFVVWFGLISASVIFLYDTAC